MPPARHPARPIATFVLACGALPLAAALPSAARLDGTARPAGLANGGSAPQPASPATTVAFATASFAKLTVEGSVDVGTRSAQLDGGWLSPAASCAARRRVRVSGTVDYAPLPGGKVAARSFTVARLGAVANCGESGPSFGVEISGRDAGLACANGAWIQGRYRFTASVVASAPSGAAPDTSLRASATVEVELPAGC